MIRFHRTWIPLTLTGAALAAGFMSLLACAEARYVLSSQLIMLSMILDGFDGTLARRLKATSAFGAELDTFVDFLSFGIAPALLAYEVYFKTVGVGGVLFALIMTLSGAARLSRFRVGNPDRGHSGYTGLPITVNAGWVALWTFLDLSGGTVGRSMSLSLQHGGLAWVIWGLSAVFIVLQMSTFHYGKPTKHLGFFLGGVLLVLLLFTAVEIATLSALLLCAAGIGYAVSPIIQAKLDRS